MNTEWKKVQLKDCVTILGDGLHGTPKYTEDGEYAFINGNNLVDGSIKIKPDTKRVSKEEYEKYKKPLSDRTVLVSINGTLGNVAIYNNEKIILGKSACYFNVIDEVDKLFIKYIVSSPLFKDYLNVSATGTTIKNISLKQMREFDFFLPPIKLQQKIASILSSLDEKIAVNNKINNNLHHQMQILYNSWFKDYEPFNGIMPLDWKEDEIYSIANIIYGAPFSSKLFNTYKKGKPIVRIRDLKSAELPTYTTEIHPKGYWIKAGDIIVGMDGEFRPYIWGNENAWLNQRICVFQNKRPLGKAFLYFTIKPLLTAVELTEVATTVIHIGKHDFDGFRINLPTTEILDRFDKITSPMFETIVVNQLENRKLATLRNSILPKLMSGELDVSEIDI